MNVYLIDFETPQTFKEFYKTYMEQIGWKIPYYPTNKKVTAFKIGK